MPDKRMDLARYTVIWDALRLRGGGLHVVKTMFLWVTACKLSPPSPLPASLSDRRALISLLHCCMLSSVCVDCFSTSSSCIGWSCIGAELGYRWMGWVDGWGGWMDELGGWIYGVNGWAGREEDVSQMKMSHRKQS